MSPTTKFPLLFAISLLFISHASSTSLYEDVCKEAGNQNSRCLKLLSTNPQIPSAKDYKTLCKLILQLAIDQSSKAQSQFQGLIKKYPSSKAIKQCANIDYTGTVNSFKSALREIVEDPQTANYDAKVAGDGPDTCGSGVAAEKIVDKVISTLNDNIHFVSVVAFLATNHLY